MKYQSELINEILGDRGHKKSSLHYESECVEPWIEETKGAYPKLCDYEGEWLNYMAENPIGSFPYETITANPTATVSNVVPYEYKSAILKGSTKYRDIDTGEILETFEEGRNLELVSVKMPVLTTTGKNLFDGTVIKGSVDVTTGEMFPNESSEWFVTDYIDVKDIKSLYFQTGYMSNLNVVYMCFDSNKKFIGYKGFYNSLTGVINPLENTHYIRLRFHSTIDLSTTQIEQGTVATTYEPYKSNILTVNEPVELRGIGEVRDTLDCLTGEVAQNIGEITLDGSENWTLKAQNNWQRYMLTIEDMINIYDFKNPNRTHCDKLVYDVFDAKNSGSYLRVYNQIAIYNNEIVKDVEQFKQWLSQNPITLQYQLATESIKTVELTVTNQDGETLSKIKPIEGTMHIESSGTNINPTAVLEVPVEAITQNLNSFIEEE